MKNNIFIFFLLNLIFLNIALAEQFTFKSSQIELKNEGNLIYASEGTAISADKNLEIKAKSFEYQKRKMNLKRLMELHIIKLII